MDKDPVLVGLAALLILSGCSPQPDGTVERRFALPFGLGTFSIHLDSNLTRLASGIIHSDYRCGDLLQQQYAMRGWAPITLSSFGALNTQDSLFLFTWGVDRYSPAECDSAQTLQEWIGFELRSRRTECTTCIPVDSGIVLINGTRWAFILRSDDMVMRHDMLTCYTRAHDRGMYISWNRLAPTPARFDFGAYARRQLATARID